MEGCLTLHLVHLYQASTPSSPERLTEKRAHLAAAPVAPAPRSPGLVAPRRPRPSLRTHRSHQCKGGLTLTPAGLALRSQPLLFRGLSPGGLAVLPAPLLGRRHRHPLSSPDLCHQSPPGALLLTKRVAAHLDRGQAKLHQSAMHGQVAHLADRAMRIRGLRAAQPPLATVFFQVTETINKSRQLASSTPRGRLGLK